MILDQVKDALLRVNVHGHSVAVGLSGGVDSVVLLHVLCALRNELHLTLSALHVHHGLSPNADQWAQHCMRLCNVWQVPFTLHRVQVDRDDQRGVEAAARAKRYECYTQTSARFIALAHHADDQAETLMLQLLRGAGVAGLAAMPLIRSLDDQRYLVRPLLHVERSALIAYAQAHALQWIHDESNDDTAYPRNFLRHDVLSKIETHFAGYRAALGRVAENAADAQTLLDVLGEQDLAPMRVDGGIVVTQLRLLDTVRAANVLRFWLSSNHVRAPGREALLELLRQALSASADAQVLIRLADVEVHRFRDVLMLVPPRDSSVEWAAAWHGETELALPDGRVLRFEQVEGRGIARELIERANVTISYRRGGERMRVAANRPTRTLKNLLQELHVPAWRRDRVPLIFANDRLVWAEGVGIDPAFAASGTAMGLDVNVRSNR